MQTCEETVLALCQCRGAPLVGVRFLKGAAPALPPPVPPPPRLTCASPPDEISRALASLRASISTEDLDHLWDSWA